MRAKKQFELPTIATYRRDELIVETAFTGLNPSLQLVSDRRLKQGRRPVAGGDVCLRLMRRA